VFWMILYEVPARHKRLSKPEFDYIHSDVDEQIRMAGDDAAKKAVSWIKLLGFKQTWAFILGKFLTDPVWWFHLFWLPAFLKAEYGIEGTGMAIPIAAVYTLSTI